MKVKLDQVHTIKSGTPWNELTENEKTEVQLQFRHLGKDQNRHLYRFKRGFQGKWIVTNPFDVPISANGVFK